VVIGNPPYIRIQALKEWATLEVEFYKEEYVSASKGNYDIYVVFVEKGLNLLRKDGRLGFILPHKFFNAQYGESLRKLIAKGQYLEKIVYFGDQQVFPKVSTYTCLLFLSKTDKSEVTFIQVQDLLEWVTDDSIEKISLIQQSFISKTWNFSKFHNALFFEKFNDHRFVSLGKIKNNISQGIRTSANEVYVVDFISQKRDNLLDVYSKSLDKVITIESSLTCPFLQGKEIKAYQLLYSNKLLIIPYELVNGQVNLLNENKLCNNYPLTLDYLIQNQIKLENREKGKMLGSGWYGYIYPKNIELMRYPKILVPDIAIKASFALDERGEYAFTSGYGITLKNDVNESIKYILGLLNSKLLDFYFKNISTTIRGGFFRYFTQFVEQLPIRRINFENLSETNLHNQMVRLVEQMLFLHEQLNQAQTPPAKRRIKQQINATDRQINQLVYELYELTDEEIAIVEGSFV
ncbi:Eco57I restriction-modification methylase domain-containing protein, partial [Anabaenopsis arnoldii]